MTFAHPYFLLLLLLLPVLAWLKGKRGKPPAFVYSSVQLVRPILNVTRSRSGAFLSALRAAVNRLRELKSNSKIVILMTDGQNNAGKVAPLTVAEAAQSLHVKVYTIGVGMRGEAPMPVGRNPFTGETVYRNQPVDIDE